MRNQRQNFAILVKRSNFRSQRVERGKKHTLKHFLSITSCAKDDGTGYFVIATREITFASKKVKHFNAKLAVFRKIIHFL